MESPVTTGENSDLNSPNEDDSSILSRAHGSKGSLHSLLLSSKQCASPEALRRRTAESPPPISLHQEPYHEEPWHRQPSRMVTREHQLSQSYSHNRGTTHLQTLVDSEIRGELQWLDNRIDEWKTCICVLADGEFTCFPLGTTQFALGTKCHDDAFELEELAATAGGRGVQSARLSLTRVALVATDPQRGAEALRIVVAPEPRQSAGQHGLKPLETGVEPQEYSFRAASHEAMIEWLFGFQSSLALVVARLRGLSTSRRRTNSIIAGDRLIDYDVLHKKTSTRRRVGSPCSASPDFTTSSSVPMTPPSTQRIPFMPQLDEGLPLYRKSSARPRLAQNRAAHKQPLATTEKATSPPTIEPAKYIPPHLRHRAPIEEGNEEEEEEEVNHKIENDHFEETGNDQMAHRSHHQQSSDSDEEPTIAADWIIAGGIRWRSGSACDRGPRPRNEDKSTEVLDLLSTNRKRYGFVGVYDGHSGDDAANRCRAEIHLRVRDQIESGTNLESSLTTAFEETDAAYCSDAARGEASIDAGATALCCLIEAPLDEDDMTENKKPRLVVANCGDCMCVLGRTDGTAVSLSTAHSPTPGGPEARRVEAAGGWITSETDLCVGRLRAMDLDDPEVSERAHERVRLNEIHRVCGEVAVARAIGDVDFKGWPAPSREPPFFAYPQDHALTFSDNLLIPTPDVVSRRLDQDDAFVLLATDGLWDVIYPPEAVQVASALFAKGAKPNAVAHDLCKRALRFGSSDNVTVVALQFNCSSSSSSVLTPASTQNFHNTENRPNSLEIGTSSTGSMPAQPRTARNITADDILASRDSSEHPMPEESSDIDDYDDSYRHMSASPAACSDPGGAADFMPFALGHP